MTAQTTRGAVPFAASEDLSVDDLDRAITQLAQHMNAETYRMLVLVREFDERFGWAKWGCASCADWLAWRCGISPGAAREKVRTANALRELPAISAAFADGKLSYSKVRALTRVAASHDEDLLLAYALDATAAQVEDRCRQIRNTEPDSVHGARHVWERRSLTLFRDRARNCVRIVVELPAEEGELVGRAVDSAVAAGEGALGVEFASERSGESWKAQQADAFVAIMKAYLGGGAGSGADGDATRERSAPAADHYQVVVHVDERALRGEAGRSDLPIETVRRLACDGSVVTIVEDERGTRWTWAASSVRCRRRSGARSGRATAAARSRAAAARTTSTRITSGTGSTAAARASTTLRCSARITTSCCTKAGSRFIATKAAASISGGPTGA
jgi:hypothetical protein